MSKESMKNYRDDIVKTLTRLMRVRSEKGEASEGRPFGPGPAEALEVFLSEAEALGFRCGRSEGYAGWAEMGPEDAPLIGAVCHLDVVPAAGWPEAYEPKVEDGRIIGRGSLDDKGPAVAVLYAMKSLLDEKRELPCRIRLIVGLDEESGSACMAWYREHEELPLAAFTADADFPVINGEKGRWCFNLNWERALAEDGEVLVYADCGTRSNVIPGEASLTYRLADGSHKERETVGRMGHASMPQAAKNAIQYALADAYERNPEDPFLKSYMKVLGTSYDGEGLGIKGADEASGELTLNVGIFKYENGKAAFSIDIRYPVTWKIEDLRRKAAAALEGSGFTMSDETYSSPLYRDPEDPLVALLMEAYREGSGRSEEPICIGGGTYARSLPNTLAFGPCFPEDENLCHQKGEYITEDTLMTAADIYRQALLKLAEHYGRK